MVPERPHGILRCRRAVRIRGRTDRRITHRRSIKTQQLIFPEIDFNKVDKLRGMNISIVTTARNDEQARALLKGLGMPFRT